MKQFLSDLIQRKKAKIDDLQQRSDASDDLGEVRAIGEILKNLADEIKAAEEQLAKIDDTDAEGEAGEQQAEEGRNSKPNGVEMRTVASFGAVENNQKEGNVMQYRNAFMEYVLRNKPIPTELRADANTTTGDVATVIPEQLVAQIIEKFDNVGMILPLITRTSYAAGVAIPTSSVKPIATWVAEAAGSDRQKKVTGSITFTWNKLRCEISMSMEVGTMALAAFEAKFVENVAKAMTYAIEDAIINGSGSGQPKGILTEDGQTLSGKLSYDLLCQAEGVLPTEYEAGARWIMNKKTFMKVMGMVDQQGQPIARVNYGVNKANERTILGRDVVIAPYVADDKIVMFDLSDYILNTVYDMGITKKQDWETEDLLTKAVMSVDGKAVDAGSLIVLTVTAA